MILFGWILIGVGAVGIYGGSLRFVRETLPHNDGRNPGFGAYESQVLPGWTVLCLGVALTWGVGTAALAFVPGLIALGFVGQIVGRLFGSK